MKRRCSLREQHPSHVHADGARCDGKLAIPAASRPAPTIEHTFPLAPGRRGRLLLPEDLTMREAERLSAMLRTLPLPPEVTA